MSSILDCLPEIDDKEVSFLRTRELLNQNNSSLLKIGIYQKELEGVCKIRIQVYKVKEKLGIGYSQSAKNLNCSKMVKLIKTHLSADPIDNKGILEVAISSLTEGAIYQIIYDMEGHTMSIKEDGKEDDHVLCRLEGIASPIYPLFVLFDKNDGIQFLDIDEPLESRKSEDNFIKIVNSLTVVENSKINERNEVIDGETRMYLKFGDDINIFQFPKKKIYIRDCYYDMFRDICKCMSKYKYTVVTGQPGIGKTSFIYVLLFLLKKNLSYSFDEDEKNYLHLQELNKERRSIEELIRLLDAQNLEKIVSLNQEIDKLKNDIEKSEEEIKGYENDIKNYYEFLKGIIEKGQLMDVGTKNGDKYEFKLYNENEKIVVYESNQDYTKYMKKCYYSNIKKIMSLITGSNNDRFKVNEVINYEILDENKTLQLNEIVNGYVVSSNIMTSISQIDSLKYSIQMNGNRKKEYENELNETNRIYNASLDKINASLDKINASLDTETEIPSNEIKIIEEKLKSMSDEMKKFGFNYYILDDKVWRRENKTVKDIYVVKGKKCGSSSDIKIYLFTYGHLYKIDINESVIKDSIIIVDTFNGNFGSGNIIISISSPDEQNNDHYTVVNESKQLYFDSLKDVEILEWFKYCIGFDIDDLKTFKEICQNYGNNPRQIYNHHLYKKNFNRDYWKHYKQLIDGVVGTTGYSNFIQNYMYRDNLKRNDLFNIVLKYDLKLEWDADLDHFILKPKDKLKFISNAVEKYIFFKFYPPKNVLEYEDVKKKYESIDDDINVRKMALKQIIAYELSTEIIKLIYTDSNGKNTVIESNQEFKLNYEKQVYIHYPGNALHLVYYILDKNNYFDLIIEGVFIKILFDDEELDKTNNIIERMEESIREYSEIKSGVFKYCLIRQHKVYGYDYRFPVAVPKVSSLSTPAVATNINSNSNSSTNSSIAPAVATYDDGNDFVLMRKCFDDILQHLNLSMNYENQRNFLIFGQKKIGKSKLAKIIINKIHENKNDIRIDFRCSDGQSNPSNYDYFECGKANPYIVVSDGVVIGEDDFADAEMIIVLANPCDEKYKTFQNKRCPLVMYIPPFTIEEVKQVMRLIENKSNGCKNEKLDLYLKNYEYYGGIIGKYEDNEKTCMSEIQTVDQKLIEDMIKGINISSISKTNYQNILIYETDENDVTVSNNLRFISDTVRNIVCNRVLAIDTFIKCDKMINLLYGNPTGDFAGNLYERIILFLMKESTDFRNYLVNKMKKLNKFFNGKTVITNNITNEKDLNQEIDLFKKYHDENKIPFIDLSYTSFPDIDALIGPFGIQITVSDKHKYAPEMTMVLQNLYWLYGHYYNYRRDYSVTKLWYEFGYVVITPRENVYLIQVDRNIWESYPTYFQELTNDHLNENERYTLFKETYQRKRIMKIEYGELRKYVKVNIH